MELMRTVPVPTVAAVHGAAYGGGANLALAADLVVAAESAVFCQSYIDRGISPDLGGTVLLPRLVGVQHARRLLLLGEPVAATEALRLGLVADVVPDAQLRERAREVAAALAAKDPTALRVTRRAHRRQRLPATCTPASRRSRAAWARRLRSPVFRASTDRYTDQLTDASAQYEERVGTWTSASPKSRKCSARPCTTGSSGRCPKRVARELEADEFNYPHELFDKMAAAGFHAIGIDEKYGGAGGSEVTQMILARELSRSLAGLTWTWGISSFAGAKSVGFYGTEEQKQRFLPELAEGKLKFSIAFTEPSGGTDLLGAMKTTRPSATPAAGGSPGRRSGRLRRTSPTTCCCSRARTTTSRRRPRASRCSSSRARPKA